MGLMGLSSSDWDRGADDGGGEDEEELTEDGVLFYVNQSGCPMDDRTWNRMWDHVAKIHPDGYSMIYKIRDKSDLPDVSLIFNKTKMMSPSPHSPPGLDLNTILAIYHLSNSK